MNKNIEKIKNFRRSLLQQIDGLTVHQLNTIPPGYNNNIIWNLVHLISVEQNLCYARSGLPITVDDKYFSPYMPGTKPEKPVDEQEIETIKALLITSTEQLQSDFGKRIFKNYTPSVMIPKVYGFEVSNIDEVIDYLLYHEGLHSGYVLALKHLL